MLDEEKLWRAVQQRDRTLEGTFVYGVLTTKVFCRPGCPSRLPKQVNVRFYATAKQAEADGLRACLRCKPLESDGEGLRARFASVCAYIRRHLQDGEALKLNGLSQQFQLSPYHFQRTFRDVVGVTPRQYVENLRLQTLKENLRNGESVTEAIYSAGFGSSSRVYRQADSELGMTPKQYRSGGAGIEISYVVAHTALGLMLLGATDRGLCFLEFDDSEEQLLESLKVEYPKAKREPMAEPYSDELARWMESLSDYLAGVRTLGRVPLALHGTAFQLKVWTYLQTIPEGTVQTYSEVAEGIGKPAAVRAVASACAANRIALMIPCHRVIRGDGGLGGYRWGLHRKRALLEVEREATLVRSTLA